MEHPGRSTRHKNSSVPVPNPNQAKPTADLNHLTNRLLEGHLAATDDEGERGWLRQAARDAESIAWSMAYPLLMLPELLEEKLRVARVQFRRQLQIRARAEEALTAAELADQIHQNQPPKTLQL